MIQCVRQLIVKRVRCGLRDILCDLCVPLLLGAQRTLRKHKEHKEEYAANY
jgi:hypothetical protein